MRTAAIDIGTNSVKLVVGDGANGEVEILAESVLITRLGDRLNESGLINLAAAERTLAGLDQLVCHARALGASRIRAAATSAVRDARNGESFLSEAKARTGVTVELMSGEEEARLARLAIALDPLLGDNHGNLLTVDIGGGSTEIAWDTQAVSLDAGAVRLHDRFIATDPPSDAEVASAEEHVLKILSELETCSEAARVVGTGGTVVNAARVLRQVAVQDYALVHGIRLTAAEIVGLTKRMAEMSVAQRREMVGLDYERADIILTGAIILRAVLATLQTQEMSVSVRGLRHGILYEMLEEKQ